MADLSTKYLGLNLKNPLVVSAAPLTENLDNIKRMEDAGAGAIVLHSLFEEQILLESGELHAAFEQASDRSAEASFYFPDMSDYNLGPEGYLEHIRKAKAAVDIPIIASLNGITEGGWVSYAKKMQEAGADALELNLFEIATDPDVTSAEIEARHVEVVKSVVSQVSIPVAVKIGPFFTSVGHMAKQFAAAGAKGLVMFNRFYQPDIDLESLEVEPSLVLSNAEELRLRLRWAAFLYGRVNLDLAITGGVHTCRDVLKSMMAGGNVVMMASVLFKRGIGQIATLSEDITAWMEEHEYHSIEQMQGSMSAQSIHEPDQYARGNYMRVLSSYTGKEGSTTP